MIERERVCDREELHSIREEQGDVMEHLCGRGRE
jgi:hypothetical protein